ncbi:RNA methyltransferase [Pseudobdellovibrio exovorus]|uniref:RNA methyltransferase n=1 Tax=Pseudobdellovibrio exovorus JSS TaxID=1184267 RepID=M4V816_9BACT|nr:RNA methyltransferase [Pseudobdellovibrio exovorus]AGH95522.1 RNA methyltransferase [Pseudobdellovibrio exovorus JSS]
MNDCSYFPQCRGCTHWDKPYAEQQALKIQNLRDLIVQHELPHCEIEFLSCGESQLRHRVDFTVQYDEVTQKHIFGFYNQNKQLLDIQKCLQMAPSLQSIYSEFTSLPFFYKGDIPIKKGSVRLRVSPHGQKGCWLDFSNVEIKELLDDQILLQKLLDSDFFVEIGQKGKSLIRLNGNLKLADPQPRSWFQTYDRYGQPISMQGLISDFTQPSWESASLLVQITNQWLHEFSKNQTSTILEFGSGLGQFTLSFLKSGHRVTACEVDQSSSQNLSLHAAHLGLSDRLQIHVADFHRKSIVDTMPIQQTDSSIYEWAFVNPARSGLKKFTEQVIASSADYIIYVSCYPQSMATDIQQLSSCYDLIDLKIVDQFPQTDHYESVALLKRQHHGFKE